MINIQKILEQIKKFKKIYKKQKYYILVSGIILLLIYSYWTFFYSIPDLRSVRGYYPNLITEVYSSDGRLIGEFAVNKRKLISFDEIPDDVKHAFVAIEDQRFYEHKGIDIKSIVAAIIENLRAVDWVRGASTITQQVSKNLSLSFEKSITRKIKEAIIAYRMENFLSKDEILYIYLNHIYLADGVYGIEAASQNYFGKSAAALNLAEASLLAGLPRRPEYYSPRKNLKRALERQHLVLQKMYEQGYINAEQKEEAINYELKIIPKDRLKGNVAPYFMDMVKQYIKDAYGEEYFLRGGLKIFTSLDADLSLEANWALRRGLIEIEQRHNRGMVVKNISDKKQIVKFLLSQNIRDVLPGKFYKGVITGTQKIDSDLYSARVAIGLVKANLLYTTNRNHRTNIKYIEDQIIAKYPSLSGYESVSIVPSKFNAGDIVNVKVTAKIDNIYYCNIEYEPEVQGALISLDHYGYIKAITGGYNFSKSQFNRALQARRQPGSVFKPIVYSAALDRGYDQISTLYDSPISIGDWKPANYDKRFMGRIPLREALIKSRNLATVRLIQNITPNYVVKYAKNFGILSRLDPYPSLALGSSVVTVKEIAQAFSVFANGGQLLEPKYLYRIYDREGNIIYNVVEVNAKYQKNEIIRDNKTVNANEFINILRNKQINAFKNRPSNQAISGDTAYIITEILKAVINEGTGRGAKRLKHIAPVAGKTGTTNDYTDAWFAGYSPNLTTVVWVGRDDNMSIGSGESGSRAALPIWYDYMADALTKYPRNDFLRPSGIQYMNTSMGYLAFKRVRSPRTNKYSSYVSGSYKYNDIKHKKQKTKIKDFKKILKDAFLLPNP